MATKKKVADAARRLVEADHDRRRDDEHDEADSRFVDDVRSWQTVEPAIDFTATVALAFALTG